MAVFGNASADSPQQFKVPTQASRWRLRDLRSSRLYLRLLYRRSKTHPCWRGLRGVSPTQGRSHGGQIAIQRLSSGGRFVYSDDRLLEVTGMHCARALANQGARPALAYRPLRSPLDR